MVSALDPDRLAREAQELYAAKLRAVLEPQHNGEFVVIKFDTGEYECDQDDVAASKRAVARWHGARLFALRVGRAAAYRMGAAIRMAPSMASVAD